MTYLQSTVRRFFVPDDKVSWSCEWKEYAPVEHTDGRLEGKPYADPPEVSGIRFNSNDGKVDRTSHNGLVGIYERPKTAIKNLY